MQEKQRPVLSISLLSSGRKETIWKCLDSLKPIMEQLFCELIIVDTGCDEETYHKMKKYTEQIIKFEWCNDFSKARNVGLKKAIGEWFMFIDDDEWFADVKELVDFFKTGEYRKFGSANYIQRNFIDKKGTRYKDSWVSRLIRLDPDTQFESSIHEYLHPVRGACKLLHCPAEHYGYIFKNKKEQYEHSRRNVSLLIDMIQKEPKCLRWWVQLAQEYRGIHEFSKLQECCQEALNIVQDAEGENENRSRGTFYAGIILAEMSRYHNKDAYVWVKKALKDKRNTDICRGRLYSFASEITYKEQNYEECEEYCKKYFWIHDKYHGNEIEKLKQGGFFVNELFEKEILNNVYCFYIGCRLKQGDYCVLKDYFWKLGWEEKYISIYSNLIPDIMEALAKIEKGKIYADIVQTMLNRKGVDKTVIQELKKIESADLNGFKNLCGICADIDYGHYYIWYMKIRNVGFQNKFVSREKLEEYYRKLFECVANIFLLDDSIFDIAEKYQVDMEKLILEISFDQWKTGVDYFCKNVSDEKMEKRYQWFFSTCKTPNIRSEYFYIKSKERNLLSAKKENNYFILREKIQEFIKSQLDFYKQFYKESVFEGEMEILPSVCRVAVKLQKVLEAEEKEDIKIVGKNLKECMKIYFPMDPYIQKYAKLYAAEKEKKLKEEQTIKNEMHILANQIKLKIKYFLENNMYAEASQTISQLKILIPYDEELEQLERRLR